MTPIEIIRMAPLERVKKIQDLRAQAKDASERALSTLGHAVKIDDISASRLWAVSRLVEEARKATRMADEIAEVHEDMRGSGYLR